MDWKRFEEEDIYWQKILELLHDRIKIIDEDLADPERTKTLLDVRILQQERKDIEFMIAVPNIFREFPEKEVKKDGMEQDTE